MGKSYVVEGKYKNSKIDYGNRFIWIKTTPESTDISKWTVLSYTVIDEFNNDQYSLWKGALGVALVGEFGAVAGIGGKKLKEYFVAIEWREGEKSLICLDEDAYKVFLKSMF